MKNDVKRKMTLQACSIDALKSPKVTSQRKIFEHHLMRSRSNHHQQ
jgi:hypothetical protein